MDKSNNCYVFQIHAIKTIQWRLWSTMSLRCHGTWVAFISKLPVHGSDTALHRTRLEAVNVKHHAQDVHDVLFLFWNQKRLPYLSAWSVPHRVSVLHRVSLYYLPFSTSISISHFQVTDTWGGLLLRRSPTDSSSLVNIWRCPSLWNLEH